MPNPPLLHGSEFVVHLFVATDGPQHDVDYRYLLNLWHRCCDRFGITNDVLGYDRKPPADPESPPGPGGMLAARISPGPGTHQVVLRRLYDVFCLAVLRAPAPAEGLGWLELEAEWSAVLGQPTGGVIGSGRILQARLADPAGVPAADAALASVVRAAIPAAQAPEGWWNGGTARGTAPSGPFAVWEASDQPASPTTWEGRAHRRIVVIAPADRDAELSAWTWSRGDPEMTPFARYLLHAAKARYELRVRESGHQGFRQLREKTDEAVGTLLRIIVDAAQSGRDPDRSALTTASVRLVGLQAGELGLVDRATRLREMRRTVQIAAANLASYARHDQSSSLFADDKALVSWLDRQLDHDATYLEAARDRTRDVVALTDHLVQRGLQRRQERFALGLTGVVGAILMVLAAIQSLQYQVPIPKPVQPAVVSGLGAFALLVSLVILRVAVPQRKWTWLAACAGGALLGATVAWIVVASLAAAHGAVAASGVSLAWGGLGAVAGFVLSVGVTILSRVRR
jgi:hypothetical protein